MLSMSVDADMIMESNSNLSVYRSSISLVLLVLVFIHVSSTIQAYSIIPKYHKELRAFKYTPDGDLGTRAGKDFVAVDVNMIAKALWDNGYKIMSLIVEKNLAGVHPYAWSYDNKRQCGISMVCMNHNNTITVFAPRDEAGRYENWIRFEYQVAASKVDRQSFDSRVLTEGSWLLTMDYFGRLEITQVPVHPRLRGLPFPSINNVPIIHWNIYNDGHVLVHGVEDFFRLPKLERLP